MTTYNDIKEHLNIKVDKHLNDGFAPLTHFWQNHKNGVSQSYKPYAKEYLQEEIFLSLKNLNNFIFLSNTIFHFHQMQNQNSNSLICLQELEE